ncbi:hypothetical protein L615_007600000250, partial [Nocardioides sp. J9]
HHPDLTTHDLATAVAVLKAVLDLPREGTS